MNKLLTIVTIIPLLCGGSVGFSDDFQSYNEDKDYSIVYLESNSVKSTSRATIDRFDSSKDAYVIDEDELDLIDKDNLNNYLDCGGLVIIPNSSADSEQLYSLIDENPIYYSGTESNRFGYYLYGNTVTEVTLGYMAEEGKDIDMSTVSIDNIPRDDVIYRIVNKVKNSNISDENEDYNNGIATTSSDDPTGQYIAFASLDNYLYLVKDDTYACSYTIYTQVWSVAKVQDSSTQQIRGVYDVVSGFTVDAEPDFYVKNYTVRMKSEQTILDASYIESDITSTVNFGGSLSFSGTVLSGGLNAGVSYSYSTTSQEIVNDLAAGSEKYWESEVPKVYNASYQLKPAIRIANDVDTEENWEYSRVEYFKIKQKSWFINPSYVMLDEYRKELGICWNSAGIVSTEPISG